MSSRRVWVRALLDRLGLPLGEWMGWALKRMGLWVGQMAVAIEGCAQSPTPSFGFPSNYFLKHSCCERQGTSGGLAEAR